VTVIIRAGSRFDENALLVIDSLARTDPRRARLDAPSAARRLLGRDGRRGYSRLCHPQRVSGTTSCNSWPDFPRPCVRANALLANLRIGHSEPPAHPALCARRGAAASMQSRSPAVHRYTWPPGSSCGRLPECVLGWHGLCRTTKGPLFHDPTRRLTVERIKFPEHQYYREGPSRRPKALSKSLDRLAWS
jgi:hypothetical protein